MPAVANVLDYGPRYAQVAVGEMVMYYEPVTVGTARRLVVYSHGAAGTADDVTPAATSEDPGDLYRVIRELVRRGYVVASFDFTGAQHWGNDAARATVPADLAATAALLGVDTSPVAWLAYSMGFTLPAAPGAGDGVTAAAVVGVAPATNLDALRSDATIEANMDTAFATWATNGGDDYDPIDNPTHLDGIPVQLWAGTSDTLIPPADVATYAAAIDDTEVHEVAGDHLSLWANVDPVVVADFVDAGAW